MTKIPGGLHVSEALAALEENLVEMQLDHVDHVMVHYPSDWHASPDRANKAVRQETWLALEHVYYKGQARSIGISHYCSQHIHDILEVATVVPSINQVEYHVGSGDVNGVIQSCRQHNITFMSYSPLCGPCQASPEHSLISGELVTSIAKKYNVTGSHKCPCDLSSSKRLRGIVLWVESFPRATIRTIFHSIEIYLVLN
jgi:diketogulonate reductase-like aldo/keto reductase